MISLVPGYELNLAIEKQIFGYKFPSDEKIGAGLAKHRLLNRWKKPSPTYWVPVGLMNDEVIHVYASKKDGVYDWRFDVGNYSRDMTCAMRLVKFMRKDGFSTKIFIPPARSTVEAAVSMICPDGPCRKHPWNTASNHHGAYDVEDKTVELAICHAALIAKRVMDA